MVIEGIFVKASYDHEHQRRGQTRVTVEVMMDDNELTKLQNGLINRRMDAIQMVINSSVPEEKPVAADTPKTTIESW
jgi:hypothetical protein